MTIYAILSTSKCLALLTPKPLRFFRESIWNVMCESDNAADATSIWRV